MTAAARRPASDVDDSAGAADARPSKTQRKNASHELQTLGAALAELPGDRIAALVPDGALRDALLALPAIRTHEGRRRHVQLIGALMRRTDAQPLRVAVEQHRRGHAHDAARLHAAERWRAELLEGDDAQTRFAAAHPHTDLQRLRALVRSARHDAALAPGQRSGRGARELFRFLRESLNDD